MLHRAEETAELSDKSVIVARGSYKTTAGKKTNNATRGFFQLSKH